EIPRDTNAQNRVDAGPRRRGPRLSGLRRSPEIRSRLHPGLLRDRAPGLAPRAAADRGGPGRRADAPGTEAHRLRTDRRTGPAGPHRPRRGRPLPVGLPGLAGHRRPPGGVRLPDLPRRLPRGLDDHRPRGGADRQGRVRAGVVRRPAEGARGAGGHRAAGGHPAVAGEGADRLRHRQAAQRHRPHRPPGDQLADAGQRCDQPLPTGPAGRTGRAARAGPHPGAAGEHRERRGNGGAGMTSADSAHESTGPVPVRRMFERRAALDGGAPALVSAAGETSYRELDRRADGVAARLLRSGIGPGDLVGVRVRRGPGMIAAMLGVLKAGAAYVPVDPGDPEERSRHVIAESGMKALVSDGPAGSPGAEGPLLLDADGGQDADGQGAGGAVPDDLDAAAYALFTSGSTGTPKGAAMTHRALANLLSWHDRTRPGCCSLRTLQFCAISFDFSFHEIFSTLCFGGTLVLPGEEVRRDPDALAAHLAEHR